MIFKAQLTKECSKNSSTKNSSDLRLHIWVFDLDIQLF